MSHIRSMTLQALLGFEAVGWAFEGLGILNVRTLRLILVSEYFELGGGVGRFLIDDSAIDLICIEIILIIVFLTTGVRFYFEFFLVFLLFVSVG